MFRDSTNPVYENSKCPTSSYVRESVDLYCRELAMNAKMIVQMDGKKTRIFNTKVSYCSKSHRFRRCTEPLLIKVKRFLCNVYTSRTVRDEQTPANPELRP